MGREQWFGYALCVFLPGAMLLFYPDAWPVVVVWLMALAAFGILFDDLSRVFRGHMRTRRWREMQDSLQRPPIIGKVERENVLHPESWEQKEYYRGLAPKKR